MMSIPRQLPQLGFTIAIWNLTLPVIAQVLPPPQALPAPACEAPALERLMPHTVASGETLAVIGDRYQLSSETLRNFNSGLSRGQLRSGTTVWIPPYNGFEANVPTGATWQSLGQAHGVRPDVLFEINGCQKPGATAFIPNSRYGDVATADRGIPNGGDSYDGLPVPPLTRALEVGLSYGWLEQADATQTFHSGLDLLAPMGSPVQAADAGLVVFVDREGDYGNVVIINHDSGRQTRYAHLESTTVQAGTTVSAGQVLGTVGQSGQPDISAPHLHFEVRQQAPAGWIAQDPALHLRL